MSVHRNNSYRDSRRYLDWLERAHADLATMKLILAHGGDPALAVFHGHQAMEKSFKAYLLYAAHQHADGHNLTWLCRQSLKLDGGFSLYLPHCARMAHFYIESRYPTDLPLRLTSETTQDILAISEKLYRKVWNILQPAD